MQQTRSERKAGPQPNSSKRHREVTNAPKQPQGEGKRRRLARRRSNERSLNKAHDALHTNQHLTMHYSLCRSFSWP
eukprot:5948176-Amphidinium_carterae.1